MPDAFSADPRILGKILLIQTTAHALPTPDALAAFLCRGLSGLPGVKTVTVQIGDVCQSEPPGASEREDAHRRPKDRWRREACALQVRIGTLHRHHGTMTIECGDLGVLVPYEPFLSSLANTIALTVENRQYAESLERMNRHLAESKASLESTVEQRTAELLRINEELIRERTASVGPLGGGASELRNILTAVTRSAEDASAHLQPGHPARAELQRMVEAAHRGFELLEKSPR